MTNRLLSLLEIQYPIIQGGMVWVSGGKLAGAVSKAGGLGLIGAGSMKPELLKQHIKKAMAITKNPIGVNIPLLYDLAQEQIQVALDEGVKIFFTSAGSPKKWTKFLKSNGAIVVHVVSTPLLAKKCEDAGVDAIVAEGFEAGGHNGRDEITTFSLIPQVSKVVKIPIIAAGGIADGKGIHAALSLGAEAAQMGTRFLMTKESSAHHNYKNELLKSSFNSTEFRLKKLVPVRLLKNSFYHQVVKLEEAGADIKELKILLGKGRAKKGMLEGDLIEGELEVGEICGMISDLPTVSELFKNFIKDYNDSLGRVPTIWTP